MLPIDQTYGYSLVMFGFFIAVAMVAGITMVREEAKRNGCDRQRIDGLCLWMLIAAIGGARIGYFIFHPGAMAAGVLELFRIWNGGLSLIGGAGAAFTVGLGYMRSFRMPMLRTLDAFAPAIAIGQFFFWLGCFFSGFCHQLPAIPAWGARTVVSDPAAVADVHLHPTAMFIAAGHFIVFGLLLLLKPIRRFNGQIFCLYLLLLGIMGLVVGRFLDVEHTELIVGLTPSFIINAALTAVAAVALLVLRHRGRTRQTVGLAHVNDANRFKPTK